MELPEFKEKENSAYCKVEKLWGESSMLSLLLTRLVFKLDKFEYESMQSRLVVDLRQNSRKFLTQIKSDKSRINRTSSKIILPLSMSKCFYGFL